MLGTLEAQASRKLHWIHLLFVGKPGNHLVDVEARRSFSVVFKDAYEPDVGDQDMGHGFHRLVRYILCSVGQMAENNVPI